MNNQLLVQAEKWLQELGIQTQPQASALGVNRNDLIALVGGSLDTEYREILEELKSALNTKKLFWGNKDDNWVYLESF
jgi:plasmid maintenance system antidote protein VapI